MGRLGRVQQHSVKQLSKELSSRSVESALRGIGSILRVVVEVSSAYVLEVGLVVATVAQETQGLPKEVAPVVHLQSRDSGNWLARLLAPPLLRVSATPLPMWEV